MNIETLSQLFDYNVSNFNKPDLLVYRGQDDEYYNISSNEFKSSVVNFALGLRELGIKQDTKVVLLSENRPEWHVVDFACHLLGAVVVPIFPTLIPEQIEYIVNNSEAELIVVSNSQQAAKIGEIKDQIKKVKNVIAFEENAAKEDILFFEVLLQKGREQNDRDFYDKAVKLAKPEMISSIIYTSGTTGIPKGVMLSHRNFVSNVLDAVDMIEITAQDKCLSFLPLCHAFERMLDYAYFYAGATIVYSAHNDNVALDLEKTGPTIMAAVPRFYEKVKAKIEAKAARAGGLKKKIFEWAIKVGGEKGKYILQDKSGGFILNLKYSLADKLVLAKIQAKTGGNLKYFISGGAPLSAEVARFFFAAGLRILEGYGLTETSPVLAVNPYERPKFGTVGKILRSVEIKIAEDGEILAKGPNIMMGYYRMPAETDEVMIDGWFHTGDIGKIDDENYLSITDRKKQLIVTSVGKKVAPQPIEKEIENARHIEQVLLIGEKRNFISALIVPDFENLIMFAKANKLNTEQPEELIKEQAVIDLIQKEVDGRQKHVSNYEKIRKFTLLPEAFTIESGLLTPTMKIKRKVVMEEFADLIEAMYTG
ncbi:MAG: long-chain fatty acid--CoA ligase [Caldithrix sp.]|nr:MAG: long-chain fatty acid--CoA ligase [Caldithrix sp.]